MSKPIDIETFEEVSDVYCAWLKSFGVAPNTKTSATEAVGTMQTAALLAQAYFTAKQTKVMAA